MSEKNKVIGIIGLGTFGIELCSELSKRGVKVIAIDKTERRIEKIKEIVDQTILIDSTDEEAIKKLPLDTIDIAVVAMAEDIEASILTTVILKKNNVPQIVSRASSEIHALILQQVGATEIINIEVEEGKRIANKLVSPNVMEQIPISKDFILTEFPTPKAFINKTLLELDLRNKYNISVVSMKRTTHDIDEFDNPIIREEIIFPDPHEKLLSTDILIVVGNENKINQIKED